MADRVTATPAALAVIERLARKHGELVFFLSGGCCEGSAAMCLKRGELPAGAGDLRLGTIGDAPFYVGREQYERWGRPELVIDVAPGASDSLSLEGLEDVHFVTAATGPAAPLRKYVDVG